MIYLNGQFIPQEEAKISIHDRGFIFGDGIYEIIRIVNGRLFRSEDHLERMDRGLSALEISLDPPNRSELSDIMYNLIDLNRLQTGEGTIYLQVTRGAPLERTHAYPSPETPPTVLVSAAPFVPDHIKIKEGGPAITVTDIRWSRCDLKTVNLLGNVMAAQEEKKHQVTGTLLVRDGYITEGYKNNVFAVFDGNLWTYPDSPYILSGITRQVIFEIAEEKKIPLKLAPVEKKMIYQAEEVFLTGTTTDILPATSIDGQTIGSGRRGPVTESLYQGLRERMDTLSDTNKG